MIDGLDCNCSKAMTLYYAYFVFEESHPIDAHIENFFNSHILIKCLIKP